MVSASSINKHSIVDPILATNRRFVFGRALFNSTGGGEGFAQFQTTVFSVLPRFVGKSESVRLFSYYVGRAVAKSMEGMKIFVDNNQIVK